MTTPIPETAGEGAPRWFAETLADLVARRELSPEQMRRAMQEIMAGRCHDVDVAAWLTALRMKGETAAEIAAAAEVMRDHMICLDTGRDGVLDTCGTGGDGANTFNISTAAALVVAAAGVPVVKHGNRSVSSRSGSADVLAAMGVMVEADWTCARRCLDEAGIAFCYAPHFHPAMRHVAAVRRRLRFHTLFNCIGPLANPARAAHQLLGVGRAELLDLLAGALARLGARRAVLVRSRDGLDEVSLSAPTEYREVRAGTVTAGEWTPEDFGLPRCSLADLHVSGPEESAEVIHGVLDGRDGPAWRIVVANAAAALVAAERADTLKEGVRVATEALAGGKAKQVLQCLAACSQEAGLRGKPAHVRPGASLS